MAYTVRIAGLTTCEVSGNGAQVHLTMLDEAGQQITLELETTLATSLILTLPKLMELSLQRLRGDAARLVFPLGFWTLESAAETGDFILSLGTPDGFKVAFAVSSGDARALVEALEAHSVPAAVGTTASAVLN